MNVISSSEWTIQTLDYITEVKLKCSLDLNLGAENWIKGGILYIKVSDCGNCLVSLATFETGVWYTTAHL